VVVNKTNDVVEDLTLEFFVQQRHLVVKLRITGSTVLRLDGSHCISVVDLNIANVVLLGNNQKGIKEDHINFLSIERMFNGSHHFLL